MKTTQEAGAPRPATAAQAAVERLMAQAIQDGSESALQVTAYHHGRLVVDAWASPPGQAVNGRTLFPIFSTGKGIAATAIHRLVERGTLAWDRPIADYWPAFAAAGKGGITLRHVLRHTAGMPMLPETAGEIPVGDWDAICAWLAAAAPLHAPGARRHYHAITYSWLLGEPARRADGRDFGRIIHEEVCQPLGLDTLYFGLPPTLRPQCVDAEKAVPPAVPPPPPTEPPPPPDPVMQRAIPAWVCPLEDWINRDDVRAACIPASNGFANARAIARHYAALLGAGVDGVRLLSAATIAATTRWDAATDGAVPGNGRWGLGYGLGGPDDAPGAVFSHGGYGGSTGFADQRHGLAVGIVKSRMGGPITGQLVDALRAALDAR